jgi:hypothetical protein
VLWPLIAATVGVIIRPARLARQLPLPIMVASSNLRLLKLAWPLRPITK